ncbi:hypothetical protein BDQ17DRAFT_1246179 [Cyathus striatus]|nr:hypothetical protein BDQ17DRAFT_1246179 [Cyathus striatus]
MAPSAPANSEPAVAQAPPHPPSQPVSALSANSVPTDLSSMSINGIDQTQIINLLRSVGVFPRIDQTQAGKEDAAQTLSALATQASAFQIPGVHYAPPPPTGVPGVNDPGPSSHPRGPPNLSQLSSVAMQAAPAPRPEDQQAPRDDAQAANNAAASTQPKSDGASATTAPPSATTPPSTGGRRGGRSAAMGSDEWSRQRKDNHKEVERRRRGNINEGINELGRIVPNGNGEKAKGAILARAVQYIHHLKENEARNIEKWTLEKLLMDQAMGDLQAQLEEVKRLWEEERLNRQRLESEVEVFRGMKELQSNNAQQDKERRSPDAADGVAANEGEDEREGKRQRTE